MKLIKRYFILLFTLVFLVGCNLPGLGADVQSGDIVIAGGNTSERQILSEISKQMLNHYLEDVNTDLITNLGSSLLILQTMNGGDTNISATMYTGTSLVGELEQDPITEPNEAFSAVVKGYYDKYDMVWLPSYGFENTYAFMVRNDFANEHNLKTISDLKPLADNLRAGVDTGWIDRQGDGYRAFQRIYEFDFNRIMPMQIGLVYDAVAANEMDVVLGYSTDGRIQDNNLKVLEDDLNLFPPYDGSAVVTMDLLMKHPEVIDVFLRLENSISTEAMQELNRISDEDKVEAVVIAREYLEEHNYFEDKEIIPLDDRDDYREIMQDLKMRIKENE